MNESEESSDYHTHIDEDEGLWIPPELRQFESQVVIRTPRATIQHFESGDGELDAYYGMVDESDFGDVEQMRDPKNPELAPRHMSIKPQGEDAVELYVSMPEEQLATDGGVDHYRELCKGMRPGLLIGVNDSGEANGPASGQLEVVSWGSDGEVLLTGYDGNTYKIEHDTPRGTVLVELADDGRGRETYVETIEVVGVAGE
jgi:hypothetical protein